MATEKERRSQLKKLLETVLACPACHGKLIEKEDGLQCTSPDCRRLYPIREGIPVLLIEESTQSDD